MEDLITVSLVARRESRTSPWEVDWALLDELHSEPMERGRVVSSYSVPGLEAMRIALSAAWRHAKHLHA